MRRPGLVAALIASGVLFSGCGSGDSGDPELQASSSPGVPTTAVVEATATPSPTREPAPTEIPLAGIPGSCLILEERYCQTAQVVQLAAVGQAYDPVSNTVTYDGTGTDIVLTRVAFTVEPRATLYAPADGQLTIGGSTWWRDPHDAGVVVQSHQGGGSYRVVGAEERFIGADLAQMDAVECAEQAGEFACQGLNTLSGQFLIIGHVEEQLVAARGDATRKGTPIATLEALPLDGIGAESEVHLVVFVFSGDQIAAAVQGSPVVDDPESVKQLLGVGD